MEVKNNTYSAESGCNARYVFTHPATCVSKEAGSLPSSLHEELSSK